MQNDYLTKRQQLNILKAQLEDNMSSFKPVWRDIGDYVSSNRTRFSITEANRGDRRNNKIINSTASLAARTLRSGLMSGVTSPARRWFRLTTPDPSVAEVASVKRWLDTVNDRMSDAFTRSNLYTSLPVLYGDVGNFGTACLFIEEDFDNVIHTSTFPIGSYEIAADQRGKVNTFRREFRMTTIQLIDMFNTGENGKIVWDNFSDAVKRAYDDKKFQQWFDVCHVIQPNREHDKDSADPKKKKYSSCYYELGSGQNNLNSNPAEEIYLRESGYDLFPVLAPRWEVTGEDVYATACPGMDALGDIKQLQLMEKRSAEAIEKMVRPPMIAPTSLKNQRVSIVPGDTTFSDTRDGQPGFRPAFEVKPQTMELEEKMRKIEQRISRVYYEDLFLMLANSDRREITAREIDERHEEKLLALGPVLEQLNQDLLDPLIDITFAILVRQGWIDDAPEELQGVKLKVEYESVMAQAQKLAGVAGQERFMNTLLAIAPVNPDIFDKVATDEWVEDYGESLSIRSKVIRTEDEVAAIRSAKMKAMQQQQQAEVMNQSAQAVKNLAGSDMSGDNALTKLVNNTAQQQVI